MGCRLPGHARVTHFALQSSLLHARTALQMAAGRPAKPGLVCALACSIEQTLKLGCCCAMQKANSACAGMRSLTQRRVACTLLGASRARSRVFAGTAQACARDAGMMQPCRRRITGLMI